MTKVEYDNHHLAYAACFLSSSVPLFRESLRQTLFPVTAFLLEMTGSPHDYRNLRYDSITCVSFKAYASDSCLSGKYLDIPKKG